MIRGVVNARHEAVVRLRVRGPNGVESDVDVIVDSGFSASLALPATMVTTLGLARQSGGTAVLANALSAGEWHVERGGAKRAWFESLNALAFNKAVRQLAAADSP